MTDSQFFSQFGEDRLLAEIFSDTQSGLCVEVGANDGEHGSNSLYFETLGWKCILIEPNPSLCEAIRSRRNATLHECAASDGEGVVTLHIVEGSDARADGLSTISEDPSNHARIRRLGFRSRPVQVQTRTLDRILEESGIDREIAFVSIDVEGHELQALRGFTLDRWNPRILLLEDNSEFKDNALAAYLGDRGYVRFHRTGVNDWYARRDDRRFVNATNRLRFGALMAGRKAKRNLKSVPGVLPLRETIRKTFGI